jgi:hypothetical protein
MEDVHERQDPVERLGQLVETGKRAYTETQSELHEVEVLLGQTTGEVQKLDQRTAQVANKVRHI